MADGKVSISQSTQCPACGHLYVDWLNYQEMFGKKRPAKG